MPISQDQRPWQERGYEARTQGTAAFPVEGTPPCLRPEPVHPACFGLCSLQRKVHLSSLCASLSQSTLAHFSFRPQNSDSTSQICHLHSLSVCFNLYISATVAFNQPCIASYFPSCLLLGSLKTTEPERVFYSTKLPMS